ncbi:MAG: hypothetical protein HQL30_11340 [Candidatus Omnitrophica bacterium]|nr:hypothetical protein [Candidatus Omnitrophota bacterium]
MISRIEGQLVELGDDYVVLKTGGISYEILVPGAVMRAIEKAYTMGSVVELVTYHYHQLDPSKAMPQLIGFQNSVEREFFEKFISVSGIGPKAACAALVEPFSLIAGAIDAGDIPYLKKLPRIGERKAAEIVARLKGKVGKYGLIKDECSLEVKEKDDIRNEALEIMLQLQYKKPEAEGMIEKALRRNPGLKTCEELLTEVYRDRGRL